MEDSSRATDTQHNPPRVLIVEDEMDNTWSMAIEPGKRAKAAEIKLVARLRKHLGNPKFKAFGERLEKINEKHERGFLTSLEISKSRNSEANSGIGQGCR